MTTGYETYPRTEPALREAEREGLTYNQLGYRRCGWAFLFPELDEALGAVVAGKHVVDLGAGMLDLSHRLIKLGAARVTAVDSRSSFTWRAQANDLPGVVPVEAPFATFVPPEDAKIAVLSWCDNYVMPEMFRLLERFETVVQISKNTDGVVCGWPGLYRYLASRPVLDYRPRPENTLIVYGNGYVQRAMKGEERAGARSREIAGLSYKELREELDPEYRAVQKHW